MPWLVQHALEAMGDRGRTLPKDPLEYGGLVDQVGYELERLEPDLRELLLALAVGFDPAGPMPAEAGGGIDSLISQASAAGLLLPEGTLPPLMRGVLLQTTPLHQVERLSMPWPPACPAEISRIPLTWPVGWPKADSRMRGWPAPSKRPAIVP